MLCNIKNNKKMIKNIIDKDSFKKGASNAAGGCLVTLTFGAIINPVIIPIIKPYFDKLGKRIGRLVNGNEED